MYYTIVIRLHAIAIAILGLDFVCIISTLKCLIEINACSKWITQCCRQFFIVFC